VVGISEEQAGGPEKHPEQELSVTSQEVRRIQVKEGKLVASCQV
jgi:hypothetical protein